jgi:hypothetical protein
MRKRVMVGVTALVAVAMTSLFLAAAEGCVHTLAVLFYGGPSRTPGRADVNPPTASFSPSLRSSSVIGALLTGNAADGHLDSKYFYTSRRPPGRDCWFFTPAWV